MKTDQPSGVMNLRVLSYYNKEKDGEMIERPSFSPALCFEIEIELVMKGVVFLKLATLSDTFIISLIGIHRVSI